MNRIFFIIIAAILLSSISSAKSIELPRLLDQIETAIRESDSYDKAKTDRIEALHNRLEKAHDYHKKYDINRKLIQEYEAYQCDSAIHYANINISLAEKQGTNADKTEAILFKCDILGHAGLFTEALTLLNTINPATLPTDLRQRFYSVGYSIYQYMYENSLGTEFEKHYQQLVRHYCDSALSLASPATFDYARLESAKLIETGQYEKAIAKLDSTAKSYQEGEREYSMLKSTQAFPISKLQPGCDEELELLGLAAISDIKGSIKENMAMRFLAELLYEKGYVRHANMFVKKSMEDASFFSARMRSTQAAQMLPLIDRQYDMIQNMTQKRMRTIIYILVAVAAIFAVGLFLIIRLTRKLSKANEKLRETTRQVETLNKELRGVADTTRLLNDKLREANKIKEVYLVEFMEMSSRSINTLDHFRKSMFLLYSTGKNDELKKSLKSNSAAADATKELFMTFDKAFLTIFPNFVVQFNSLLKEEGKVETHAGEPFSTEIRIYALLRMGITDNKRIADFLRCSLSTIYTYRSKMKARSLNPDTFEEDVLEISAIENGQNRHNAG
ncbi:MAG: DUF948 domain-containing protein [Bacteroides sp.]|nr:DUF948 domain-containing protein [Bacteroides sp.]